MRSYTSSYLMILFAKTKTREINMFRTLIFKVQGIYYCTAEELRFLRKRSFDQRYDIACDVLHFSIIKNPMKVESFLLVDAYTNRWLRYNN